MEFDVYPKDEPVELKAGARSDELNFFPLIGDDTGGIKTIFMRVTTLTEGVGEAHRASVGISADDGVPTTFAPVGPSTPIRNKLGAIVARADVKVFPLETPGVSVVRIRPNPELDGTTIKWRLQITNNDTVTRRFTFVVAKSTEDAQQPWLDVAAAADFDVLTQSGNTTHDVPIVNLGTGPLTLDGSNVKDVGAGFSVTAVPPTIAPYSSAASQVAYTAGPEPGRSTATVFYTSDDPRAGEIKGHNRRLRLSAIVRKPLWAPGDILVVDRNASDGVSTGALIRVDARKGVQTLVCAGGLFNTPTGVAVEPDGNAVISDSGAFACGKGGVIRVNQLTGVQTEVSSADRFVDPNGVVALPDGTIVVVDQNAAGGGGGLIRVNPETGQQTILSSGNNFGDPIGVAREATGNFVVLDSRAAGQDKAGVIRVTPEGVQTLIVGGIPRMLSGIAVAADGKILVTGSGPASLLRIDPDGGEQQALATGQPMNSPSRLAVEADGSAVVTDLGLHGLVRVVGGNQTKLSKAGILQTPVGIAVVPKPAA